MLTESVGTEGLDGPCDPSVGLVVGALIGDTVGVTDRGNVGPRTAVGRDVTGVMKVGELETGCAVVGDRVVGAIVGTVVAA